MLDSYHFVTDNVNKECIMSKYHTKEIPYFYHIELNVFDLDKMEQFYTKYIGLQALLHEKNRVILGINNNPIITLYESKVTKRNQGLYHFALLLDNRVELANILNHLLLLNYPLTGASDHVISEAIYLDDPEGNGIEIAVDRDPSMWPIKNGELDILYRNKPLNFHELLLMKSNEAFLSLSPQTTLGHVHLHVHDVMKTGEFYRKILNMNITIDITPSALFLSYADYHHHLAMNTWTTYNIENENDENLGLRSLYLHCPDETFFERINNKLTQNSIMFSKDDNTLIFDDPANHQIILSK